MLASRFTVSASVSSRGLSFKATYNKHYISSSKGVCTYFFFKILYRMTNITVPLHCSLKNFSYIETGLPGLNKTKQGLIFGLLKDTTQRRQ